MAVDQVAVTGLGLMTGLGLDLEASWAGLIQGATPVRRFTSFDPQGLACPFGVELPTESEALFADRIKRRSRSQMTRGTMIALATAEMAVADSGLDMNALDRGRVGIVVGATGAGCPPPRNGDGADPHRILKNMTNSPATWISLKWKLTGPSYVVATACSSGVYALDAAHGLITSGRCDVVISGSADSSLNYADVEGFGALMALAQVENDEEIPMASRPFDRRRNGFVIGEGGGILVLESLDFAQRRQARIYAHMPPPALNSEAYNILSPRPNGLGMAECMQLALTRAEKDAADIDYLNAHGTSTCLNDLYETQAVKTVFGPAAAHLPISSTKSMTGHCLAGAGGVEAVICCKALAEDLMPGTMNLTEPDPELDLDYIPNQARPKTLKHVMSNSFAFGGHNGVGIFSKPV